MTAHTQLAAFGLFDARVPRYTSYPTAPQFAGGVGVTQFTSWTEAIAPGSDISLLGRDVLNYFALVVDRPNWRVHLLAGQHNYVIQGP